LEVTSNLNQTDLNKLIKVFRFTGKLQVGEFDQGWSKTLQESRPPGPEFRTLSVKSHSDILYSKSQVSRDVWLGSSLGHFHSRYPVGSWISEPVSGTLDHVFIHISVENAAEYRKIQWKTKKHPQNNATPPFFTSGIILQMWYVLWEPGTARRLKSRIQKSYSQIPSGISFLLRSRGFQASASKPKPWPLWIVAEMVVLLQGSPISMHELNQTDHQISGHLLPWPFSYNCLAGRLTQGRVLVHPNFFYLKMMEAAALLGNFNAAEFFCSLPQICASTQCGLWALQSVPLTLWLGFCSDMHFQLLDLI